MKDPSRPKHYAIGGYDPVAYFEQGRPVRGTTDHAIEHDGDTWLFATAEHSATFRASPEKFVPAYGGRCAFATSLGKAQQGDPTKWSVKEGRLFLNSNSVANLLWRLIPGRVQGADRNWATEKR